RRAFMTEAREQLDDLRIDDGIEHLRCAAREMIDAGRAFLDVAEELLERPELAGDLLGAVGAVGDQLRRGARAAGGGDPRRTDGEPTSDRENGGDPIERITVEG